MAAGKLVWRSGRIVTANWSCAKEPYWHQVLEIGLMKVKQFRIWGEKAIDLK